MPFVADYQLSVKNRVQEAAVKHAKSTESVQWELIGHLQSNKVKEATRIFDRIQSVDSMKLLEKLNRIAEEEGRNLPILLQCNTGEDPNKHGFSKDEFPIALELALSASNLKVDGLMTIAPLNGGTDAAKRAFEGLRELRDAQAECFDVSLKELSMGMTGDLEIAIEAGSTQIRIGTALYGYRVGSVLSFSES